jgi:hypothetical protein
MYRPTGLGPLTSVPALPSSTSWCCRMGRRSHKARARISTRRDPAQHGARGMRSFGGMNWRELMAAAFDLDAVPA